MRYIISIVLFLALSGCSLKTTVPASTAYQLSMPQITTMGTEGCREKSVQVSLIQTPTLFKFTQMFYNKASLQQSYYANSVWGESPADRLQTIFVAALSQSGIFKSVVGYESIASYDYLVEIHLYDFMQYFDAENRASVRVNFDLVLVGNENHKVLGKFNFNETLPSETANAFGGVEALNTLVSKGVINTLEWTATECK